MRTCIHHAGQERCVLALAIAAALASSASYLVWPLTQNVGVHFAGVHQALASGRGMAEVWNFRGINYNLYLWALYRIATTFVDFFDRSAFDPLVRGLHLLVLIVGSAVWSRGLAELRSLSRLQTATALALMVFGVTAVWKTIPLHAEDVGLTLLLFAWGWSMRRSLLYQALAGVVAGFLPLIKGVTALYAVIVVLASYRAGGRRRCSVLIAVLCSVLALEVGLLQFLAPKQLTDLVEAATYQGGRLSLLIRIERLPKLLDYFVRQPVLLPGLAAALLHTWRALRARDHVEVCFMLAVWSVGFVTTFIQGVYYTYHLTVASTAAVYSLTTCLSPAYDLPSLANSPRSAHSNLQRSVLFLLFLGVGAAAATRSGKAAPAFPLLMSGALVVFLALAVFIRGERRSAYRLLALTTLAATIWLSAQRATTSPKGVRQSWARSEARHSLLRSRVEPIVGSGRQLLLASYGSAARTLNVVSACRHYFPIPLARHSPESARAFERLAGHQEALQCFRSYHGKYVLVQTNWFRRRQLETTQLRRRYKTIDRFSVSESQYELLERKSQQELSKERGDRKKKSKKKSSRRRQARE